MGSPDSCWQQANFILLARPGSTEEGAEVHVLPGRSSVRLALCHQRSHPCGAVAGAELLPGSTEDAPGHGETINVLAQVKCIQRDNAPTDRTGKWKSF